MPMDLKERQPKLLPGRKITLGDYEFSVPPLNLAKIEELEEDLVSVTTPSDSKVFAKERNRRMVRIIHAAMSRNYTDLTEDQVRELVDMHTMIPCFRAALDIAEVATGKPGETVAPAATSNGAGGA